jgi:hypothetical protein
MRLTRTHKSWDLNPPPSAEANLSSLLLVGENEQVQAHDTWPRGPTILPEVAANSWCPESGQTLSREAGN